jgi:myosin heavy subunit
MMGGIVAKKYLEKDDFRVGKTKVFFKAGIMAKLEDCRDEVMAKMMISIQALIRWYHYNVGIVVHKTYICI